MAPCNQTVVYFRQKSTDISGSSARIHGSGGKPTKLGSRSLRTSETCTPCSHTVWGGRTLQMMVLKKRSCNTHGVESRSRVRALLSQCQSKRSRDPAEARDPEEEEEGVAPEEGGWTDRRGSDGNRGGRGGMGNRGG